MIQHETGYLQIEISTILTKLAPHPPQIVTNDVCAICYDADNIVSADEIRKKKDICGKNPLLVCRYCFEKNIEIPCSGGRTNMKQKKDQAQSTKRKQLDDNVESGRTQDGQEVES